MIHINIALLLFIFSAIYFINCVSALRLESINGGIRAEPGQFTYTVAIVTKQNSSNKIEQVGSGVIISKNLVLSVAQCFLMEDGSLKKYRYYIHAGTINWKMMDSIKVDVDLLYFQKTKFFNDISVIKLKNSLDIDNNALLSKLNLPLTDEKFTNHEGLVSGYGFHWVIAEVDLDTGIRRGISGASDNYLRYAQARIVHQKPCSRFYRNIDLRKHFCATMSVEDPDLSRGICQGDAGNPLVINNTIIGLASIGRPDCDDEVYGSIYVSVSAFLDFIHGIVTENPLNGTVIHFNIPHIEFQVAPAA